MTDSNNEASRRDVVTNIDAVARIAKDNNVSQYRAQKMLDSLAALLGEALADGRKVDLRFIGRFDVRHVEARNTYIPATGETKRVPARDRIQFRPTAELRRRAGVDE